MGWWKVKTGEERVQKVSGRNEIVSSLRNYDLYPPLSKASFRDFLLKGRYRLIAVIRNVICFFLAWLFSGRFALRILIPT